MRLLLPVAFCLIFLAVPVTYATASTAQAPARANQLEQIAHDIAALKDSQAEIKRDELNYRIEKNLLKEAYGSSLQTLNAALTFILGLFAILGYLGIRDIGSMKKEYSDDLEKLAALRKQLESDIARIGQEQTSIKETLKDVSAVNKDQADRIRILELQERAAGLIANRNWVRALEYVHVGLQTAPNDRILRSQKALCTQKLGKLPESIDLYRALLQEDTTDSAIALNLAEALISTKKFKDFDDLKTAHESLLLSPYERGAALVFLELFKASLSGEADEAKAILKRFAPEDLSSPQKAWMSGWDFSDATQIMAMEPDSDAKRYFSLGVSFLTGALSVQQLLQQLG